MAHSCPTYPCHECGSGVPLDHTTSLADRFIKESYEREIEHLKAEVRYLEGRLAHHEERNAA